MNFRRIVPAALALLALISAPAFAEYPDRPITLVVPFPPGGGNDAMARIVGERMARAMGGTITIENKPGAGGGIGGTSVQRAAPDGYTILLGHTGSMGITPNVYPNITYDPRKDFRAIGLIGQIPLLMVVTPSVPAKTVGEFVALAKASPGKFTYASSGVGTGSHLSAEILMHMTGIQMVHVPYRGSAPALTDLIGGRVDVLFNVIPAAQSQVQAGAARALAVTSTTRSKNMPDVPTTREAGIPDYESVLYYGLLAPAGTPDAVIAKLNGALNEALRDPETVKRLAADGAETMGGSPEDHANVLARDLAFWAKTIKETGLKLN